MEKQITCIGCPLGCAVTITMEQGEITSVTGYTCSCLLYTSGGG